MGRWGWAVNPLPVGEGSGAQASHPGRPETAVPAPAGCQAWGRHATRAPWYLGLPLPTAAPPPRPAPPRRAANSPPELVQQLNTYKGNAKMTIDALTTGGLNMLQVHKP